ncbi:MAG: hypothetical protein KTR35_00275 [Gammaproteobacteria bacterium]|nr:hypothetical protein [Gammaproteobacteria bacterium]
MLRSFLKVPTFPVATVVLTGFLLASCSSSDDSSDGDMAGSSPYVGTWASGCFQLDSAEYSDETIVITAETFTYSFNTHNVADCSDEPMAFASGQIRGNYTEFSDTTTDSGLTAREVSYTVVTTALADGSVIDGPLDGQTIQDIVHIDGSDLLYFGEGDFEAKVIARPTALNLDLGFTRQ